MLSFTEQLGDITESKCYVNDDWMSKTAMIMLIKYSKLL